MPDSNNNLAVVPSPASAALTIHQGVFDSPDLFEHSKKVAQCLSESSMVPAAYKGDANLGNVMIAIDLAYRLGLPPLMVMQNLYVVYGNPSWSGQMVIALINQSGMFSGPIEFEYRSAPGKDDWGCRVKATLRNGPLVYGPWVDITMAKLEGWYDRKDKEGRYCSKWRTIPDMMLRYRAGSYFGRTVCPHVTLGLRNREEMEDIGPEPGTMLIDINDTPRLDATSAPPAAAVATPPAATAASVLTPKPKNPTAAAPPSPPATPPSKAPRKKAAAAHVPPPQPPQPPPVHGPPEPPATPPVETPEAPPKQEQEEQKEQEQEPPPPPQVDMVEALAEFLHQNKVTVDNFLGWLSGSGRDTKYGIDATKIPDLDSLPPQLIEDISKDTNGLGRCVILHRGKP